MESPNDGPRGGGPTGGPPDPRTMSRAEYIRSVQASATARQQQIRELWKTYHGPIEEQVRRLLPEYQPGLLSRLVGVGRDQALGEAAAMATSFAISHRRRFSDAETQACAELYLAGLERRSAGRLGVVGVAAAMVYRGRRTFRFPLYTPGAVAALAARPPPVQYALHAARFGAYYAALWLCWQPVFGTINSAWLLSDLRADPRLSAMQREAGKVSPDETVAANLGAEYGVHQVAGRPGDPWGSDPPPDDAAQGGSISARAQPAWGNSPPRPQPQQPTAPAAAPPRDSWDAYPDDLDDASPVASSSRAARDDAGGSAWDRIRRQGQHPQPGQDGQPWPGPQAAGGQWGGNDGASSPSRGPRDGYTFSSSDEEKALAKGQAQKEFDELLERERSGVDQERDRWNRK